MSNPSALLVLPRLRVQNANAISSPMTWGFPAMSAFVGAMYALERRLPDDIAIAFHGVGVICHDFSTQVTNEGYTRAFHLTRNPVGKDGGTAAIVEEGRVHLDITLVFSVSGDGCSGAPQKRDDIAGVIADIVAGMRIAGGSVIPQLPGRQIPRQRPALILLNDDASERDLQFKSLRRRWLPGFALVSRHDLLQRRLTALQKDTPEATALDAWLDLSRLNIDCEKVVTKTADGNVAETARWEVRRPPGWVVPIPVGYGALSDLYDPGTVMNARDTTTPLRFVESLYSIGQWISPHRLNVPGDLLWYVQNDLGAGLYQLRNDYRPTLSQ
jgi:CRISPR-associated protein Csy2